MQPSRYDLVFETYLCLVCFMIGPLKAAHPKIDHSVDFPWPRYNQVVLVRINIWQLGSLHPLEDSIRHSFSSIHISIIHIVIVIGVNEANVFQGNLIWVVQIPEHSHKNRNTQNDPQTVPQAYLHVQVVTSDIML